MQVEIYKEVGSPIQKNNVILLVKKALQVLKKDTSVIISVAIVKGQTGKVLNKLYRGVDSVPSVLSFEEKHTISKKNSFVAPKQKEKYIGEIIISDPVVRKRAKENKTSYTKEFNYLIIHGFLHLMGYTHKLNKNADLMEMQEDRIMKSLKLG